MKTIKQLHFELSRKLRFAVRSYELGSESVAVFNFCTSTIRESDITDITSVLGSQFICWCCRVAPGDNPKFVMLSVSFKYDTIE